VTPPSHEISLPSLTIGLSPQYYFQPSIILSFLLLVIPPGGDLLLTGRIIFMEDGSALFTPDTSPDSNALMHLESLGILFTPVSITLH
ncbi:hypothetical protein J6590_096705, partial [Homalodisca vitripennis]